MSTAVIVVIGNEILAARFPDENSPWLARRCRELGIDLRRMVVVPDEEPVIAATVGAASAEATHVFTAGGVGPTHDDRTMAGIALAFGVPLVRHPELERALRERMGDRYTAAAGRMADVPEGCELWWDGEIAFPLVVMRNVCILPGVPELLRRKFDAVAWRLAGGVSVSSRTLVATAQETAIAHILAATEARHPSVQVGSYPSFTRRPWTVRVTLDSRDLAALDAAEAELRQALAPWLEGG